MTFYLKGMIGDLAKNAPVNLQASINLVRMRTNAINYSFTSAERQLAMTLSTQGIARMKRQGDT
jgi:hypothetical protein